MANRVTEVSVQTSLSPTDAKKRVTEMATLTSITPSDAKKRVTEMSVMTSITFSGGVGSSHNRPVVCILD